MKGQAMLPLLVFLSLVALAHSAQYSPPCHSTYCVSLTDSLTVGTESVVVQPGLALLSVAQVVAVAFAASSAMLIAAGVQRKIPRSILSMVAHLKGLTHAPGPTAVTRTPLVWLPIESISAGRLTSKMLRAPNFFGPGRP